MKWKFMRHGDTVWVDDENGICVAECDPNEDGDPPLTNGRLIAAAPELLEALIKLYDRNTSENRAQAHAAISKATGTQS